MKILGEALYVDSAGIRHEVEGIGNISDNVSLRSLKVEGTLSFEKISCDTIEIEGSCDGDSLTAQKFSAEGTVEVDSLNIAQIFKLEGLPKISNVAAAEVSIESQSGSIGNIKCTRIKIFHDEYSSKVRRSRVRIKSIEADTVELENCEVEVVKCQNALIGTNCAITKLFVAGEFKVADDSTVDEVIRTKSDS